MSSLAKEYEFRNAYEAPFAVNQFLAEGAVIDMAVDHSSTPGVYSIQPPQELYVHWYIERILVYVEDTGSIDAGKFGNGIELINGISIVHLDDDKTIKDYTVQDTIKNNAQWGAYCYDVDVKTWGTGSQILLARWTFGKALSLHLNGINGGRLEVRINDDLSGLDKFTILAQGRTA